MTGQPTAATTTSAPAAHGPRLAYLPGLDGLRALAVIAVLLYHAGATWLPGGFLGVEVFFVVSGYLITSLLLAERAQHGHVDLKAFWLRRARRLLPAAFALIVATLAYAALVLPGEVATLRGDALAAFAYVTNWYLIAGNQSYFEAVGRPSLLRHLWSLAVEEQFYLLWPLALVLGMRLLGRARLLWVTLGGAVASTLWMALLFQPEADPSRLYYGTDTRASGLLVGAALAFVWAPGGARGRLARLPFDLLATAAFAALAFLVATLGEFTPFLYRGGFALVALATAVLIAVVAAGPGARFTPRLLGWAPLRWIGTRSYGIYLWHWPLFNLTRPELDTPLTGWELLALRLLGTLVLAEVSYRAVERPIRGGALGRGLAALRHPDGQHRAWLGVRFASVAAALLVSLVPLGVTVVNAQPPAPPAYLELGAIDTTDRPPATEFLGTAAGGKPTLTAGTPAATPMAQQTATATPTEVPATRTPLPTLPPTRMATPARTPVPEPTAAPERTAAPQRTAAPRRTPEATAFVPAALVAAGRVTAVGDSVMLSAATELQAGVEGIAIDAAIGRQTGAAIAILQALADSGRLGDTVVLHLGNNGVFTARQFDQIMELAGPGRRVVFLTVKVPRAWQDPNNAVIRAGVSRNGNAVLVDWQAATTGHPELFWDDGIHARPAGAQLYAGLVAAAVAGR